MLTVKQVLLLDSAVPILTAIRSGTCMGAVPFYRVELTKAIEALDRILNWEPDNSDTLKVVVETVKADLLEVKATANRDGYVSGGSALSGVDFILDSVLSEFEG